MCCVPFMRSLQGTMESEETWMPLAVLEPTVAVFTRPLASTCHEHLGVKLCLSHDDWFIYNVFTRLSLIYICFIYCIWQTKKLLQRVSFLLA
jgi:hypothetical protein